MSSFECPVVKLTIEPHPNADAIEIAKVGDYQSIVKKGAFKNGDLAVYLPEQAVLPQWLLVEMGFWNDVQGKGTLNGASGNRVKAIKLRGVLSQGLVLNGEQIQLSKLGEDSVVPIDGQSGVIVKRPTQEGEADFESKLASVEGDDVAEWLGITKYEPALPSHMAGKAIGLDFDITHNYDFDNLKKHPNMFQDGEEVVITEKIHGTLLQIIAVPKSKANERFYKGRVVITSKGLGGKGIILDHTDETNLYAQCVVKHGLLDKMMAMVDFMDSEQPQFPEHGSRPIILFGEVFGKTAGGAGVQDLTYNDQVLDFRAFDLCDGVRGQAEFAPEEDFGKILQHLHIYRAPVLYRGPYSKEKVLELTDGMTTLTGPQGQTNIREGVVVKSATEAPHAHLGRKIAKSVSEAYLLRKTANATEYQ